MKGGLLIILAILLVTSLAAANIVFATGRFADQETSRSTLSAISGWLDFAWHWRMPITISNSGGALNDYQLKITINTTPLVAAGKMQANGNDIRFTDSDGMSVISYWIDSDMNTASTVIWIKAPSIPAGNSTIYMYYGNAVAPAASSGNATFIFFDDFENGFNPGIKWNVVNLSAGSVSLSTTNVFHGTNSLRITDSPNGYNLGIYANFSSQTNCVIDYSVYFGLQGSKEIQIRDLSENIGPCGGFVKSKAGADALQFYVNDWTTIGNFPAATWYQSRIAIPDTKTAIDSYSLSFYNSSNTLLTEAPNISFYNNADLATLGRFMYTGTSDSRTDTYLDLVRVRAYAAIEPTCSVGSEQ